MNANRTLDEKVCDSVDGDAEETFNEEMYNNALKDPTVAGMRDDRALIQEKRSRRDK